MKQQIIDAGKVVILGFISSNMVISAVWATFFIWSGGKYKSLI